MINKRRKRNINETEESNNFSTGGESDTRDNEGGNRRQGSEDQVTSQAHSQRQSSQQGTLFE